MGDTVMGVSDVDLVFWTLWENLSVPLCLAGVGGRAIDLFQVTRPFRAQQLIRALRTSAQTNKGCNLCVCAAGACDGGRCIWLTPERGPEIKEPETVRFTGRSGDPL